MVQLKNLFFMINCCQKDTLLERFISNIFSKALALPSILLFVFFLSELFFCTARSDIVTV